MSESYSSEYFHLYDEIVDVASSRPRPVDTEPPEPREDDIRRLARQITNQLGVTELAGADLVDKILRLAAAHIEERVRKELADDQQQPPNSDGNTA